MAGEDAPPRTPAGRAPPGQEDSPTVQRVRRMNEAAAPRRHDRNARDFLAPSLSPRSKSAIKRGAAAHGVKRAKTSHRSLLAPGLITWATEVAWLSGIGAEGGQRNVKELSEEDTILAGAKIVYFVTNDLNPEDLKALTFRLTQLEEDSLLWHKVVTEFGPKKSKWQNGVMSYVEATVVKLMTAWLDEPDNRGRDFSVLSKAGRLRIWRAEFTRVVEASWRIAELGRHLLHPRQCFR